MWFKKLRDKCWQRDKLEELAKNEFKFSYEDIKFIANGLKDIPIAYAKCALLRENRQNKTKTYTYATTHFVNTMKQSETDLYICVEIVIDVVKRYCVGDKWEDPGAIVFLAKDKIEKLKQDPSIIRDNDIVEIDYMKGEITVKE